MISHGHVFQRADGFKADCGGRRHCAVCAAEQNALDTVLGNPGAIGKVLEYARQNHHQWPVDLSMPMSEQDIEAFRHGAQDLKASQEDWEAMMLTGSPTERPTFAKALESLINSYSLENGSDTPDFILAAFMREALQAFDVAVKARDGWYGGPDPYLAAGHAEQAVSDAEQLSKELETLLGQVADKITALRKLNCRVEYALSAGDECRIDRYVVMHPVQAWMKANDL